MRLQELLDTIVALSGSSAYLIITKNDNIPGTASPYVIEVILRGHIQFTHSCSGNSVEEAANRCIETFKPAHLK